MEEIIWVILAIVILFIVLILGIISAYLNKLKSQKAEFQLELLKKDGILKDKDLEINKMLSDSNEIAREMAKTQLDEWKEKELEEHRKIIMRAALERSESLLAQWRIENEDRIRKDAANRSVRNVLGKVTEHLIPFSEAMKQFNPKDIRFIGSPIDLIVFDGAEELKKDEVRVWFIEVKTGTSALSKRQQLIKDAIQNKRISWMRVNMKSFGDEVNDALAE